MSTATETIVETGAAVPYLTSFFDMDNHLSREDDYYPNLTRPASPKGKGVAQVAAEPTIEPQNDDEWEDYDPPAALRTAPKDTDEILISVLQTSIDNVRAGIAEKRDHEIREAREREEAERAAAESIAREAKNKGKGKEIDVGSSYLEQPASSARPSEYILEEPFPGFGENGEGPSTRGLIVLPIQPKKSSRFSLTRILQWRREKEAPRSSRNSSRVRGSSRKTSNETPPNENTAIREPPPVENATVSEPPVLSKNLSEPSPNECVSCFEEFGPEEMVKVPCHKYCQGCFERLVATSIQNEQQWPAKCCLNDVPFRTILAHIPEDLKKAYRNRSEEYKIPVADRIYCSEPGCNIWIKPSRVNKALRIVRCDNGHRLCTICHGPRHKSSECPQDQDLALTNQLAEDEGWQHCSKCRAIVEHADACEHMTCRCGHQFCYVCGLKWKTCACGMDQLVAHKELALARREERQLREAQAESELRDALRQIEEFERAESIKAEKLRQERLRQEEEERRKAEMLRQERMRKEEEARNKARELERLQQCMIRGKFRKLGRRLEKLHDLQKDAVASQHQKEREVASQEASASTEELAAKQEKEMAEFVENTARYFADWQEWYASKYNDGLRERRKIEDGYLRELQDFHAKKKKGAETINEHMIPLRKKLDKDERAWCQRRDDWLARYRHQLDEDTAIKAELFSTIARRHEDSLAEAQKELNSRQAAELRWIAPVMAERARLLGEMERAEVETIPERISSLAGEVEEVEVAEGS